MTFYIWCQIRGGGGPPPSIVSSLCLRNLRKSLEIFRDFMGVNQRCTQDFVLGGGAQRNICPHKLTRPI